jgi:hypothetical protein
VRLIERRMSLRLFNLFGVGAPSARSTGMVLAPASRSVERHQTAFRGPARWPSDQPAVAREARRPRNLSVPARRSLNSHGSIPRRGDGPGGRSAGGSRPRSAVCPRPNRIGSVRHRLARRAASVARAARPRRVNSSTLISPLSHHRSPAGGQSTLHGVGRVPQHDARGLCLTGRSCGRGRRWCPSSAPGSPDRAGVSPITGRSWVLSLRQGFWVGFIRSRIAGGRRAPACATGGTRSGQSSPPGSTAPSACPSAAPGVAPTP